MLKLGVVERDDLRRSTTWLGRKRHVSFFLLKELAQQPDTEPEEYDGFVERVRMPNGVWKRTARGRLAVLDALLLRILESRFGKGASLKVLDLAASNGVTSVDLYRTLTAEFAVDFVASDLYRDVVAVRSRRWPWVGIFDTSGNEIQHIFGHFVLPAHFAESIAYPVNHALKQLCRSVFLGEARAVLGKLDASALEPFDTVPVDRYEVTRLPLLSKNCLEIMCVDPNFRFEVCDILKPLPRAAHVVRAMNILTKDHFPDEQRERAVRNCIDATLPNCLLILGWSPTPDPKTVEASIYEVQDTGLCRLASTNGGSEIDRVVERVAPVRVVDSSSEPLRSAR